MTQTYQARYRLRIGESWREPGELVPEAATWFRVDSLVHHGRLVLIDVDDADLDAAVARYCPDLAEQITATPATAAAVSAPAYYPPDPLARLADLIGSDTEAGEGEPDQQPDHEQVDQPGADQQAAQHEQPAKKTAPRRRASKPK